MRLPFVPRICSMSGRGSSSQYPKIHSKKVGVISISGSGCVMSADFAAEYNIELAPLSTNLHVKLNNYFPPWAPISNPLILGLQLNVLVQQKVLENC
jgi:hypothetical protein